MPGYIITGAPKEWTTPAMWRGNRTPNRSYELGWPIQPLTREPS